MQIQSGSKKASNLTSGFDIIILAALMILTVLTRFFLLAPNLSPVLGLALFSGMIVKDRKLAFVLPLAALLLSDLVLGLYDGIGFVYLSYAAAISIGMFLTPVRVVNVFVSSMGASLIFFIFSNLGVWMFSGLYPQSASGLAQCFVMALPFFHYTYLGTLLGAGALLGDYSMVSKVKSQIRQSAQIK